MSTFGSFDYSWRDSNGNDVTRDRTSYSQVPPFDHPWRNSNGNCVTQVTSTVTDRTTFPTFSYPFPQTQACSICGVEKPFELFEKKCPLCKVRYDKNNRGQQDPMMQTCIQCNIEMPYQIFEKRCSACKVRFEKAKKRQNEQAATELHQQWCDLKEQEQSKVDSLFKPATFTPSKEKVNTGNVASPSSSTLECTICSETIQIPYVMVPCGHLFCDPCSKKSLQKSKNCPICRQLVTTRMRVWM